VLWVWVLEHSGAIARAEPGEFRNSRKAASLRCIRSFADCERSRLGGPTGALPLPDPTGEWQVASGVARIRIIDCDGRGFGVWCRGKCRIANIDPNDAMILPQPRMTFLEKTGDEMYVFVMNVPSPNLLN
jgi:hypothetical protein